MSTRVLIAHALGEESYADQLAPSLTRAGYEVIHGGTVLVGESPIEEATKALCSGGPVVLCGTVRAVGTAWVHRLIHAARQRADIRVFAVKMEEEAYVEQLALDGKVLDYWRNPEMGSAHLVTALNKYYPVGSISSLPTLLEDATEKRYRDLTLESCDIIDLANLPDHDRHLAIRQLELRRLYVPLRVNVEVSSSIESQDVNLKALEEKRLSARHYQSKAFYKSVLEEENDTLRVPVGYRLRESQRLVVLGDPGAGKSTLIRWIATAYLLRLKNDPDRRELPDIATLPDYDWLPIVIRCRDLPKNCICGALEDILRHTLRKAELSDAEAITLWGFLRGKLQKGEALLLIDGLDEIPDAAMRSRFCQQLEQICIAYPSAPILVTSRIVGYREMGHRIGRGFEHVIVADLSRPQKEDFARRWCAITELPERRDAATTELIEDIHSTDRIERLTDNPMLLTTMALVKRSIGRLPSRRADLYWSALGVLLNWRREVDEPIDEREAIPQLGYIAYAMCDRGVQQLRKDEIIDLLERMREEYARIHAVRNHTPEEFLRILESRTGILIEVGHTRYLGMSVPVFEFRHLTFQEYLAARALVEGRYPDRIKGQGLSTHVATLAGRISKTSATRFCEEENVVSESWREALRLCVASYDRDDVDDVLQGILTPTELEDFSITARPRAVLAALCLTDDPNVSEDLANKVLEELINQVRPNDSSRHAETSLGDALNKIGTSRWSTSLVRLFVSHLRAVDIKDTEPICVLCGRVAAAQAPKTRAARSVWVEKQLSLIRGDDADVRIGAALALAELAATVGCSCPPRVTDALMSMLEGSPAELIAAARALRWLNDASLRSRAWHPSNSQKDKLLELLQRPGKHHDASQFLCSILGRSQTSEALSTLLDLSRSDVADIRRTAIEALGNIKDSSAVEPLIALLSDTDVREAAIEALGNIGDTRAVEPLLSLLEDSDTEAQSSAARALGNIKDLRAVEPLIAISNVGSSQAQSSAAYALGNIQDPRAVEPLVALLKHGTTRVQEAAAYALGNIQDPRAVEPLVALLKAEDTTSHATAARALGNIKDPRAVEPLIALMISGNGRTQSAAAQALAQIHDTRTVEFLTACLSGSGAEMRSAANTALTLYALVVFLNGGVEQASEVFQSVLQQNSDANTMNNLVYCHILLGRYEAAARVCAAMVYPREDVNRPLYVHNNGVLSSLRGEGAKAEALLRDAWRLFEESSVFVDPEHAVCMLLLDGHGHATSEENLPIDAAILLNLYRVGAMSLDEVSRELYDLYPTRYASFLSKIGPCGRGL